MRGRKVDTEFLTNFITACVEAGKFSSEDILKEAQNKIEKIDTQIKEVEKLKAIRSKLLDVVLTFDKTPKEIQSEDSKILTFFKIQHPHICKFICDSVKDSAAKIESLYNNTHNKTDILFCIKQLVEHKVISKVGEVLLRGELYSEYIKFVLRAGDE
jgi:hypothetical protein